MVDGGEVRAMEDGASLVDDPPGELDLLVMHVVDLRVQPGGDDRAGRELRRAADGVNLTRQFGYPAAGAGPAVA